MGAFRGEGRKGLIVISKVGMIDWDSTGKVEDARKEMFSSTMGE